MKLVSVIIPYYKKRNHIRDTLVSVINQSYNNLEVIIIYDDTNLNDFEFLQKIAKSDNRIKIVKNEKKLGAGLSRNIGIERSEGKYIAFLDADDVWHRDKLKNQIKIMLNKKADLTYSSYKVIDEKDRNILLTNEGMDLAEKLLSEKGLIKSGTLQDLDNIALFHSHN